MCCHVLSESFLLDFCWTVYRNFQSGFSSLCGFLSGIACGERLFCGLSMETAP